jgi:hypothetical protein
MPKLYEYFGLVFLMFSNEYARSMCMCAMALQRLCSN